MKFSYDHLTLFHDTLYHDLITKNNLHEEIRYNKQDWWLCYKNKVKYFLPSTIKEGDNEISILNKLPIKLTAEPEKMYWKEKVVYSIIYSGDGI